MVSGSKRNSHPAGCLCTRDECELLLHCTRDARIAFTTVRQLDVQTTDHLKAQLKITFVLCTGRFLTFVRLQTLSNEQNFWQDQKKKSKHVDAVRQWQEARAQQRRYCRRNLDETQQHRALHGRHRFAFKLSVAYTWYAKEKDQRVLR